MPNFVLSVYGIPRFLLILTEQSLNEFSTMKFSGRFLPSERGDRGQIHRSITGGLSDHPLVSSHVTMESFW